MVDQSTASLVFAQLELQGRWKERPDDDWQREGQSQRVPKAVLARAVIHAVASRSTCRYAHAYRSLRSLNA